MSLERQYQLSRGESDFASLASVVQRRLPDRNSQPTVRKSLERFELGRRILSSRDASQCPHLRVPFRIFVADQREPLVIDFAHVKMTVEIPAQRELFKWMLVCSWIGLITVAFGVLLR